MTSTALQNKISTSQVLIDWRPYVKEFTDAELSVCQEAVLEWLINGRGNACINAVAGSGKTFLLTLAAKLLTRLYPNTSGLFLAFNREIVKELNTRLSETTMAAQTLSSLGHRALMAELGGFVKVEDSKYDVICRALVAELPPLPKNDDDDEDKFDAGDYVYSAVKLARIGRLNLVDFRNKEALRELTEIYDIDVQDDRLWDLVREAVNIGNEKADRLHLIDFADQLYLPNWWDLSLRRYDWVFVDESQDLNHAQAMLLLKVIGKRVLAVGDPNQSIYLFAGAGANSFYALRNALNAVELPLSVCYRCGTSHLELAQRYVPRIEAAPGAVRGAVEYVQLDGMLDAVRNGDLILSRCTAPLVRACIQLIRKGIPARVRGRDVSASLTVLAHTIAKKYKVKTPDQFLEAIDEYRIYQSVVIAKQKEPGAKIQTLNDKCDSLIALQEGFNAPSVDALCANIDGMFSNETDKPPVTLCSIHRAKGLEADRVLILDFHRLPMKFKGQSRESRQQEVNLTYVALTRPKSELVLFVEKLPVKEQPKALALIPQLLPFYLPMLELVSSQSLVVIHE